jgi:hypothetical protein
MDSEGTGNNGNSTMIAVGDMELEIVSEALDNDNDSSGSLSGSNEHADSNGSEVDNEDGDDDYDNEDEDDDHEDEDDDDYDDDEDRRDSDREENDTILGRDEGNMLEDKENKVNKHRRSKVRKNINKRKRNSVFLTSSPRKQRKKKTDGRMEETVYKTKKEIGEIFVLYAADERERSSSLLVKKLVEYVITQKVRTETFTKKHSYWTQIRDSFTKFSLTIARSLTWFGKDTYKEEMEATKDPKDKLSKRQMASAFMRTVTDELYAVEKSIIQKSLQGFEELRSILQSMIFASHGIRLQFSIPSLSVLYKSLQSDTWKNVPLMSLQVHEAEHLNTHEFKEKNSPGMTSLQGAMFHSFLHVRKSRSCIRHKSTDSYIHSVVQAVHKSSMRFFIDDLEKVRVQDNHNTGKAEATEARRALLEILSDLDRASEVIVPNPEVLSSLCHIEGWEGSTSTTRNFNHDPALFFQHLLKHLRYSVVENSMSGQGSAQTMMIPIEIPHNQSCDNAIAIEDILQKYFEGTSVEVTCNQCNNSTCVHTCNIDQQCFLFLQVKFVQNGGADLPSVSFPENGKIYFKAVEKSGVSTSADSHNEECYKVEAVISYKPSEGGNEKLENGCFRTITWDYVYDNDNIHSNTQDAVGTILRDGYHDTFGKGYIYILVNENSLKEKPNSSKLLTDCSPRRATQQGVPPHDRIPSLLEHHMSPVTLVDFNHFKFVNKVDPQVSKKELEEYILKIQAIEANSEDQSLTISLANILTKDLAVRLRSCQSIEQIMEVIELSCLSLLEKESQEQITTQEQQTIAKLCEYILHLNTDTVSDLPEEKETNALDHYERLASFPAIQKLLCLQDPNKSEWFNLERTDLSKGIYRQREFSLEELHLLTKIHSIVCMRTNTSSLSDEVSTFFHAAEWKDNSAVERLVKECLFSHVEKFFQAVRDHGFEKITELISTVRDLILSLGNDVTIAAVNKDVSTDGPNSQTTEVGEVNLDDFLPGVKKVATYMNHKDKQNVNLKKIITS